MEPILFFAAGDGNPTDVAALVLIQTIVVFLAAFIFAYVVIWPKITKGLDDRDAQIASGIKAAAEAREETARQQAEFEAQIASAREEADKERAQLRTNFQQYRDELKAKAEDEAAKLKERALSEIESAKYAAVTELHAQAGALAATVAGKILQREISASDQDALVMESLKEMATSNN